MLSEKKMGGGKDLKGVTIKKLAKFGKLTSNANLSTVENLSCKEKFVPEKDVISLLHS